MYLNEDILYNVHSSMMNSEFNHSGRAQTILRYFYDIKNLCQCHIIMLSYDFNKEIALLLIIK